MLRQAIEKIIKDEVEPHVKRGHVVDYYRITLHIAQEINQEIGFKLGEILWADDDDL